MRKKIVQYKLNCPANKLNQIIAEGIKKNVFKKRHNISGKISLEGGFEIYNNASFTMFTPNLGPLVKLNVSSANSNPNGTESILKLERINGLTFLTQYWFSLFFTMLTLGIVIYLLLGNGLEEIEAFFLPLFGIGYYFLVRLIANGTTESLISKVEKMMQKERIKYKKL